MLCTIKNPNKQKHIQQPIKHTKAKVSEVERLKKGNIRKRKFR